MKIGDKVKVLSHEYVNDYVGLSGVIIAGGGDGDYDFMVEFDSVPDNKPCEEYFYKRELELIEERPERYASREVNGMDVLDLINHWNLNFSEGCILKYLLRDKGEDISDFKKIADYANREVKRLEDCK